MVRSTSTWRILAGVGFLIAGAPRALFDDGGGALLGGFPAATASVLAVTSPNGGEVWQPGEEVTITWTWDQSVTFSLFRVELYRDGVFDRELADLSYFTNILNWTVCEAMPAGSNYTVRVIATTPDPEVDDFSDAPFSIQGTTGLTVVQPNGGEAWPAGTNQEIQWTPASGPGYVNAWLYKDGVRDVHLGMDVASNGVMLWKVPRHLEPADYTVQLVWLTPCGDTYLDISDAPFSVIGQEPRPALTVTRPVGGEVFSADTVESITWTATDPVGDVEIWRARPDGSGSLIGIAPMSAGQFNWAITPCGGNADSNGILLRWTEAGRPVVGRSNGFFAVENGFEPVFGNVATDLPQAPDIPIQGATYTVTWTSTASHGLVDVEVVSFGTVLQHLGRVEAGAGAIPWLYRSANASALSNVTVRVNSGDCYLSAASAPLTIPASGFTPITLIAPAGETWPAGTRQTVSWDAHGFEGTLELKLPDVVGTHWGVVRVPAAAGSIEWLIPQTLTPGDYQVSIRPVDCIVSSFDSTTTTAAVTIGPASGVFGDTDNDGDVDLRDLARLQRCFVGDAYDLLTPPCDYFDVQPDGYSDLADFYEMQQALSGPTLAD